MFNGIYQNRTVLITGHTGFKGAWLSLWLHHLGANVIGYSLKPPTNPNLFELCNLKDKLIHIQGDVRDFGHLKDIIKEYKPEIIFHMAAQSLVRRSYHDPVETYSTNVMGTVHLLEAVRHVGGVKAVINVTSDKCYENKEWIWGYRESDPMGGYDPYSSSKGCAELVTNAYLKSYFNSGNYKEHGVSLASVRAGNVIGGGDWAEDRLIPDCIKAVMKNSPIIIRYPDAVRPWQHILEPLYGYLLLAQRLCQDGAKFAEAWNFGPNDEDVKPVRWIAEHIVEMWGDNARWEIAKDNHPHEAHCLKLDCSKAKSKIEWQPRWDLKIALEKTVEWYKRYCNHEDMFKITMAQVQSYEKCIQEDR
ncbi:MAG: CDP-glucose 4,6-dehydratase [Deltaproteobacteria bacterium]|nr:CDP-glucose 4,6-dehydratase [Deltaproteobacteria bacterium]